MTDEKALEILGEMLRSGRTPENGQKLSLETLQAIGKGFEALKNANLAK